MSSVTSPYAIAQDAAGNLYIAEAVSISSPQNAVVKETWMGSGYTQSTVVSGLAYPVGVAVDGAGNVYIADQDATKVLKETPMSGGGYSQSAAFTNLGNVKAVAVDGSGNVYISSLAYGLLKETLSAGSYVQSTIARTVYAFGITVDAQGNIYLGDDVNNQVLKETLSNNSYTQSTIATGLNGPHGVAVDGRGNVYIANTSSGQIVKETLSSGSYIQSTLANGLNDPLGVTVDSSGNVFASSAAANNVWKMDFSGPPSLSFAATGFGSTGSDSPKIVTVQNVGNATLSFPAPGIGNNPSIASNFTLDNSGSSDCPLLSSSSSTMGTLAAGDSCLLPISFRPAAIGTQNGVLVLTDNNLNAAAPGYTTQSISLSGTGIQATSAITWPAPVAITYGTPLSATQLDANSTVAGTFAYSPAIGTVLNAGPQTLSVTFTPTDTNDYTTKTATTTLAVNKATPTITWATPSAIAYGTPLSATQLHASSAVAGTFVYSPAIGSVLNAGPQTLSVTFTPTDTSDYATASASTNITVSTAALVLTFAPIATQTYGAAPFAVNASSASSGAVTYTVLSGPATIAGNLVTLTGVGTVVLSANQAASGNYAAATANTSFKVGLPFTLATSTGTGTGTASATVAPGAVAGFTFTLMPSAGTKLPDTVTFTATGLPTGATATFSPATIAAGSTATSVTLSIQTSNTQTARNARSFSGGLVSLGFLLLPLLEMKSTRKRLPQMSRLSLLLLAVGLSIGTVLGMTGCSGGNQTSSTATTPTAQNYTIVVTAKDATIGVQSSTNFILTVQ